MQDLVSELAKFNQFGGKKIMDLRAKTLEMLNIKPNQHFTITGPMKLSTKWTTDRIYYFDENLVLYYDTIGSDDFSPSMHCQDILHQLLTDPEITIKPVVVPTKEESIAISYLKLAGYKYLAKDENGNTYAYKEKPHKDYRNEVWEGTAPCFCEIDISFLSWEDKEPYSIEEA